MVDDCKYSVCLDENNPKLLIIMRGIPSCGKTTRAKELANNNDDIIFSADKFWGENYVENFDIKKISQAHNWCRDQLKRSMQKQLSLLIVDNTNIKIRDIMPYIDMAKKYEYRVRIEEPISPWWNEIKIVLKNKEKNKKEISEFVNLLFEKSKSTHCVPRKVIEKMTNQYVLDISLERLIFRDEN